MVSLKCKYADNQNTDIATLKIEIGNIKEFVKEMNENHLPHINEKLDDIHSRISKLNIWDKLKSITLMIATGIIGTLATYIFLR